MISRCAEELARAMREEYIVDPQGRTVRAKHVARTESNGRQIPLWADIRTANRAHMHLAFQQRRQQILGDCRQLKVDVDSFNENRCQEQPIQMVFDFTEDLAEEAAAALVRQRPRDRARGNLVDPQLGAGGRPSIKGARRRRGATVAV